MLFNSLQYGAFLAAVVAVYWQLPRTARKVMLLVCSYGFYASWDWRFAALLGASTLVDFTVARALGTATDPAARKLLLACSVAANLTLLGFFKYFDFFWDELTGLLATLGFSAPALAVAVVFPVGISFYTFTAIGYIVDVYRGEQAPTRSLLDFAVFISFFPQLLAGPIVRARRMIPQYRDLPRRPDPVRLAEGLELILIGLFMKVAVADALSTVTGSVFGSVDQGAAESTASWPTLWIATLASVVQFILDFAGYSNIARGSAKLLGIELPYNFRQPLTRSRSFQDFWRREHMTLMAWFRDYVFRPLRRRGARWRNHLALLAVFTLSGLWHRADWLWVSWGLLVGVVVVAEQEVQAARERARERDPERARAPERDRELAAVGGSGAAAARPRPRPDAGPGVGRRLGGPVYVFVLMALQVAWVRAGSVGAGLDLYRRLLWPGDLTVDRDALVLFCYALVALVLVDRRQVDMERREGRPDPPTPLRAVGFGAMIVAIVVFSGRAPQPFVYFRF